MAIEVDATSATLIEDYVPLHIPEVWVYREHALHIFVLQDGQYYESESSPTFPGLPVHEWIPRYVEHAWRAGSSVALREFDDLLNGWPK